MVFRIGETGKTRIAQEYLKPRYSAFVSSDNGSEKCDLRMRQLESDVLQISNKSGINQSEHAANLEQRISNANSPDDFTILGMEINKCSESERTYLSSKYIARYLNVQDKLYKNKPISPQNLFEGIFRKSFTKDEAEQLCLKYKEILEEPDLKVYTQKLFMQIKKDFDLDYLPFEIKINEQEGTKLGTNGWTSSCLDFMDIKYHMDNPLSRVGIFVILMHELNHAKQNEIAIATDYKAYAKAIAIRAHQDPQNSDFTLEDLGKYIIDEIGTETIAKIENKNGKIEAGSQLYKQGKAYIDNTQNYIDMTEFDANVFKKYKKQITEKESYEVQYKAEELYYYLMHQ